MARIHRYPDQLLQPIGARYRSCCHPAIEPVTVRCGLYQSRLMCAAKALKVSSCAARKERVSSSTSLSSLILL